MCECLHVVTFEIARCGRYFAGRSTETISISRGSMRVGMVVFGDTAETVLALDDHYQDRDAILDTIWNARKAGGGTQTHRGLNEAATVFAASRDTQFADRRRVMVLVCINDPFGCI